MKQIDATTWEDDGGHRIINVHQPAQCAGDDTCMMHKPSDHSMRDLPLVFRVDRMPLAERICEHGVGHPDPDCVAYLDRAAPRGAWGIHGCDGCCGSVPSS